MIIHIVGTSGAGKTWAARRVIEQCPVLSVVVRDDRVVGTLRERPGAERRLFVAGVYDDVGTSGCDKIKDVTTVFDLIRTAHKEHHDVLYEGLFTMNHTRGIDLWNATRALRVVRLDTPMEECWARVQSRRALAGNTKPLTRHNTEGTFVRARNYTNKLKALGCPATFCSSGEAPDRIMELLRMSDAQ